MNEENTNPNANPFGDTVLGGFIGAAILALACCVGIGSCNALMTVASCHHDEQAGEVAQAAKTQTEAIAVDAMTTIAVEAE